MRRFHPLIFVSVSLLVLFTSCTSNEIGNAKDIDPASIYFDYRVWGDEDAGFITVRLQYRFAGPSGTTLLLENPSKAELDGIAIQADSSKMNGAYYEVTKPVKDFTGQHSIVFTDMKGQQYKEEFNFQPINIKTSIPKVVKRSDLIIDLNGLEPKDFVRLMLSDTASFSEGIVRIDSVINGRIRITEKDLETLVNGPVNLEISREDEKRIKNGTRGGGKMSISYGVKREFMLKD